MKAFIILCFTILVFVGAEEQYETGDFDIEDVLSNDRLLKGYSKCLLDKGPCTPEVKRFKEKIPEILETKCTKCTERQKDMGKRLAKEIMNRYPDMWKDLVAKYDPEGKYQKSFQDYLSQ